MNAHPTLTFLLSIQMFATFLLNQSKQYSKFETESFPALRTIRQHSTSNTSAANGDAAANTTRASSNRRR